MGAFISLRVLVAVGGEELRQRKPAGRVGMEQAVARHEALERFRVRAGVQDLAASEKEVVSLLAASTKLQEASSVPVSVTMHELPPLTGARASQCRQDAARRKGEKFGDGA